jgi:hypothetical protein
MWKVCRNNIDITVSSTGRSAVLINPGRWLRMERRACTVLEFGTFECSSSLVALCRVRCQRFGTNFFRSHAQLKIGVERRSERIMARCPPVSNHIEGTVDGCFVFL